MPDHDQMMQRQGILADFGEFVLRCDDLDEILTRGCRLVAEALGTRRAKVLEIRDEGQTAFVRAGVGWGGGVVGHVSLAMNERSSEAYSVRSGMPVITRDIGEEDRFDVPPFMRQAGVVALVNVPIFLPGGQAFGLLQVDDTRPRAFSAEDTEFLRTYATILGPVIDRLRKISELRATQERFRLTVEAALDYAIFMTDPEDRVTDWLPGAQAVFGWSAEEVLGRSGSILFTAEDRAAGEDRREIERAKAEGVAPNVRWHSRKDGRVVFIDGSVRALKNDQGELRGFLKIGQDVTERRAAEEVLRQSEERLSALVRATSDVVYRMSADWTEMHQLDGRNVLAADRGANKGWWEEYIPAEDRPVVRAAIEGATRSRTMFELEHRVRRSDIGVGWVHSRAVPILDETGAVREWFGASSDITARKKAEAALSESEERFRQFGEASPDVLWMRDAATLAFEYLSPAFEATFGRSRAEQLADNRLERWLELVHPEDREALVGVLKAVREGQGRSAEFRIRRQSDGEERWIRNTDFPLHDLDGRVRRIGGIAEDVTEERSSAARLEVLIAELQHRARNLLGVISSVAGRTLERGGSVGDFRERLQALSRAQGLLSRSGSDTVELGAMVRAELAAHTGAGVPKVTISGPDVRLTSRQVQNFALAVHELTTNAVKYGALKGDEARLSVRWSVTTTGNGQRLLVLDWVESGVRMPPQPGERRGYGRELIEKALSYALRARTDYALGDDGVRCRIELPLA